MKVIIIDLDHTLIHSVECSREAYYESGMNGTFLPLKPKTYACFKRPHADDFLKHCFANFDKVLIWSTGTKEYVFEIVYGVFGSYKFDEILTRDECNDEYQKDFTFYDANFYLRINGVCVDSHHITFVDDKDHTIINHNNARLVRAEKFQTNWEIHVTHHHNLSRLRKRRRSSESNDIKETDDFLKRLINIL